MMLNQCIMIFIRGYRYFLSPLLGNICRFSPSCSEYAIEAIQKRGLMRGGILILRRLMRCHPWCSGGIDEVPHDGLQQKDK